MIAAKGLRVTAIASRRQLQMSLLRWACVTVPLLLLLGFLSGRSVPAGDQNGWYVALTKPAGTPPGWLFPVAWSLLYAAMGLALAIVLNARGAHGRGVAVLAFAVQFALNLAWTPLFFGAHRIGAATLLIGAILVVAIVATVLFGRIRRSAAWLMVPYLAWLCYAGALTWGLGRLNPAADGLASPAASTQVIS